MRKGTLRSVMVLISAVFLMAACGEATDDDETVSAACPVVEGDRHVAEDTSTPDEFAVMLHVVGRECITVGETNLYLYAIGDGDVGGHSHAPYQPLSMAKIDTLTVTDVAATMPSMGHGTAKAPELGEGGAFTVNFQMPGEWKIEVEFSSPETTTPQQAVFMVNVK